MIDVAKIEKLMLLMTKHGFDVVESEHSGEKISLARRVGHSSIFQQSFQGQAYSQNSASSFAKESATYQDDSSSSHLSPSSESSQDSTRNRFEESNVKNEKKILNGEVMTSPFVGTFYRSPGPDAPVFVEVGSKVKKGQSLCIVEAMKLMNEIECEIDGEIIEVLVDNAKPVEFGTPLFVIAPSK